MQGILVLISLMSGFRVPDPTGATVLPDLEVCTGSVVDEVSTTRPAPSARLVTPAGPSVEAPPHYFRIDSISMTAFVPFDEELVVLFDHEAEDLSVSAAPFTLTGQAEMAAASAPDWMRDDLRWNLGLLSEANQDRYAALILSAEPQTRDEVAFQVAHLSWTILANPNWDESLLAGNAELVYTVDQDLDFVQVVDHPGPGYYSTTEYVFTGGGSPTTVEIPREIYYWYVVMPKVSDEVPLQDATVYDMFWREYLYTQNDAGFPLLSEAVSGCTSLWDGLPHNTWNTVDTSQAVDVVSWWVYSTIIEAAWGNRPIQPNIIAHEHNGNCGETQDLLSAAARTCLIPAVCTMDINEDHVWVEFWWEEEWHPWQPDWVDNPYIAYDFEYGGSKECSCIWSWRNDGLTWDDAGIYTETCTLTVVITDSLGIPVDNARVSIASEAWQSPSLARGTWGETDRDGTITFVLGDSQDYYVSVASRLGNYPVSGYLQLIDDSQSWEHYYWNHMTALPVPSLQVAEGTPGSDSRYLVEVEYDLPWDLMLGRDFYATPRSEYAERMYEGSLDFFLVDEENLLLYLDELPFTGYWVQDAQPGASIWFHTPSAQKDYYAVFSGYEHAGAATLVDLTVRLWEHDGTGMEGGMQPAGTGLVLFPNPSSGTVRLSLALPEAGPATLEVYDISGRVVADLSPGFVQAGTIVIDWEGAMTNGRPAPSGLYLVRAGSAGAPVERSLVLLR